MVQWIIDRGLQIRNLDVTSHGGLSSPPPSITKAVACSKCLLYCRSEFLNLCSVKTLFVNKIKCFSSGGTPVGKHFKNFQITSHLIRHLGNSKTLNHFPFPVPVISACQSITKQEVFCSNVNNKKKVFITVYDTEKRNVMAPND